MAGGIPDRQKPLVFPSPMVEDPLFPKAGKKALGTHHLPDFRGQAVQKHPRSYRLNRKAIVLPKSREARKGAQGKTRGVGSKPLFPMGRN